MTAARQIVERMLAGRGAQRGEIALAYAPANIALVKYWGKRDEALNLPVTGSLSISLGPLGSHVELARSDAAADGVWLNGKKLAAESSFARRAGAFLDLFRPAEDFFFDLKARNTVPTAAGFASSASGFAALAKAADGLFGWGLSTRELSILARLGSGSAARSLEDGFVEWQAGTAAGCVDSALRDNRLRTAQGCHDAWRTLAPADPALPGVRQRLAQRWLAVGEERLRAGELEVAARARDAARTLDPDAPGLAEFSERLARARR